MKSSISKQLMTLSLKPLVSLSLVSLFFLPTLAIADDDAIELLNRMNKALHQLNYKGNLAYLQGNSLSTLHVDHSVINGIENERVVRLNEAGSEVSRELKGFSLSSIPQIRPEMEKVYSFDLGRQNRVADIPCRIITARPKDRERYLQKYCIDTASGMLLDYMLVGKSHKPVEQFMFTTIEIRVPEAIAANPSLCEEGVDCSLQGVPVNSGTTTAILDQSVTAVTPVENTDVNAITDSGKTMFRQISNASLEDGWIMEELPAGFEISQAPHLKEASDNVVTKHYIVSDGLSSLSVFVSPLTDDALPNAIKVNSGALNVVTQEKDGQRITVVGEVPEITLKNIVKNLRKKK